MPDTSTLIPIEVIAKLMNITVKTIKNRLSDNSFQLTPIRQNGQVLFRIEDWTDYVANAAQSKSASTSPITVALEHIFDELQQLRALQKQPSTALSQDMRIDQIQKTLNDLHVVSTQAMAQQSNENQQAITQAKEIKAEQIAINRKLNTLTQNQTKILEMIDDGYRLIGNIFHPWRPLIYWYQK